MAMTTTTTTPLFALAFLMTPAIAAAQGFETGQHVYATPSGAANDWYADCVVKAGRSNTSYQVACGGQTYWISADHISTTPPRPMPDPMYPGRMVTPIITPSRNAAAGVGAGTGVRATSGRVTPATTPRENSGAGPGTYAGAMARRIAQDRIDAANAVLKPGKYSCYVGGQYTFSDIHINGPHSYTVTPGGSGSYSYANGALTFQSGPYAGAYSRMVDGHTIGPSTQGNTNLGTQCGFDG